jgi:hypothetical protein
VIDCLSRRRAADSELLRDGIGAPILIRVTVQKKENIEMVMRLDVPTKERLHLFVDPVFTHHVSPTSRLERSSGCENAASRPGSR